MKRRPDKGKTGPDPISLTGEVLDNLNRGMIRLDSNMNLTYANRTASRFLGKRHATLVGPGSPKRHIRTNWSHILGGISALRKRSSSALKNITRIFGSLAQSVLSATGA